MNELNHLFENNRIWADKQTASDPDFFKRLFSQQSPEYLWIGCSDSRVPANQIVGLLPGELFVHRNVANLIVENDLNCLSVIQYAVEVLKVKHIIVCGHYGCGGVKSVLDNSRLGLVDDWLSHIENIKGKYLDQFSTIKNYSTQFNKLCELNVIEQVFNISKINTVKEAWQKHQILSVHGWIYDIKDGLLQDVGISVSALNEIDKIRSRAVEKIFSEYKR